MSQDLTRGSQLGAGCFFQEAVTAGLAGGLVRSVLRCGASLFPIYSWRAGDLLFVRRLGAGGVQRTRYILGGVREAEISAQIRRQVWASAMTCGSA
jgi:hypothetical protein